MPQNIRIPKQAFRTACRDYSQERSQGVDACVWRELLQNSRDAGATRVEAWLEETPEQTILTFRDNGCGMDDALLEKAMLTYAGSVKAEGAAGGFGMAKLLLVFAPDACEIRTREFAVRVEGIEYTWLDEEICLDGAEFKLFCPKHEAPDLRVLPTRQGLEYLLSRSNMRGMKVYLNGSRMEDSSRGHDPEAMVKEFEDFGGKAYYWKRCPAFQEPGGGNVCVLQHRGIWVCDESLPSDVRGCLIINLEADPKAVLAASRCSLAHWDHKYQIQNWMTSLARNARQVLKTKRFVQRWEGEGLFALREKVEAVVSEELGEAVDCPKTLLMVANPGAQLERLSGLVGAAGGFQGHLPPSCLTLDRIADSLEAEEEDEGQGRKALHTLLWRPAMMIVNELDKAVHRQFLPETMGPRVQKVLSVWTELIRQFLIFNRKWINFGVGWIFSDDTEAMHKEETDSTWFLLNPLDWKGTLRVKIAGNAIESRDALFIAAAHEVAHSVAGGDCGHSDEFVKAYDRNMALLLGNTKILNNIWKGIS